MSGREIVQELTNVEIDQVSGGLGFLVPVIVNIVIAHELPKWMEDKGLL